MLFYLWLLIVINFGVFILPKSIGEVLTFNVSDEMAV